MESYRPPTTVQCPSCKCEYDTKFGTGPIQSHSCSVCGRSWIECLQIDVKKIGEPQYIAEAAKNHPNISSYNQRLIMDLLTCVNHFARKYRRDFCGESGCKEQISDLELILNQSLEDGWPPQRTTPYLCAKHYAIRRRRNV